MQIVIDIPEKDIPSAQELMTINLHFIAGEVCECSYPYKVLPKGHGRLIDADAFSGDMFCDADMTNQHTCYYSICKLLDVAQTIIEADKEALEQEPCEVSEYDKDHIWYKGRQYISLRRFLEVKSEALEQEPCEDAVSREASVDACLNGWNKDYKEIVTEIRALPPVTPAEKVGHWEWVKYDNSSILGDWVCSECNSVAVEGVRKYNEEAKPTYKYCPQCGCKMEEVM